MTELADVLQQIKDSMAAEGATVEIIDNDVVITFPDGTTQVFEGAAHLMGSGATQYNDDMGTTIDLLDAQGVIPPVEMAFSVPVMENELSIFDQVVAQPEVCIDIPVTPDCSCDDDVEGIIYGAFGTGYNTWLNTENSTYCPFGTEENDFIMTRAPFAFGYEGNDFIVTFDTCFVSGGDGDDVLVDFYSNGTYLLGGEGNDLVVSLFGDWNTLCGGEGDDTLIALGWGNYLFGGDGDDILLTFGDYNNLYGGEGDDLLIARFMSDGEGVQSDGEGNYLDGGSGDDCLFGADGVSDVLKGGDGNDYLDGGAISYIDYGEGYYEYGADALYGGAGDDTLVAYDGWHLGTLVGIYDGGEGFDRLDLSNTDGVVHTWGYEGVTNIEMLDMENGVGDDAIWLNPLNVIDMTDDDNELFIIGDDGDKLYLNVDYVDYERPEDWTKVDEDCLGSDGNVYDTYTMAGATIFVDTDILVLQDVFEFT